MPDRVRRPCLEQGCPHLTTGTRCPTHARAKARAREHGRTRKSTAGRGYGAAHQRARAQLAEMLPAPCGYCPRLVLPGYRWVAAHVVDGRPEYGYVPAHPECNERAKGGHRDLMDPHH